MSFCALIVLSHCPQVAAGAKIRLSQTTFIVERVPLVICASGLNSEQRADVRAKCEAVGATFAKEWRTDVTHLVTPQMQWTPKFLLALAALVPVVNFHWLDALRARSAASDSIPDVCRDEFAPLPPVDAMAHGVLDAKCYLVDTRRASLFENIRLVCFSPMDTQPDSARLIELMGGTVIGWDGPSLDSAEASTHVLAKASEGFHFLFASDHQINIAPVLVDAIRKTNAQLITPLQVRTALVCTDLERAFRSGSASQGGGSLGPPMAPSASTAEPATQAVDEEHAPSVSATVCSRPGVNSGGQPVPIARSPAAPLPHEDADAGAAKRVSKRREPQSQKKSSNPTSQSAEGLSPPHRPPPHTAQPSPRRVEEQTAAAVSDAGKDGWRKRAHASGQAIVNNTHPNQELPTSSIDATEPSCGKRFRKFCIRPRPELVGLTVQKAGVGVDPPNKSDLTEALNIDEDAFGDFLSDAKARGRRPSRR